VGRVEASVITAAAYARLVRSITGLETIVRRGGRTLGASRPGIAPGTLPDVGDARIAGRDYRVASFDTGGFAGQSVRVSVLSSRAATAPALTGARVLAAAVALAVFLAVAFGLAMVVSRSLQAQIARFLEGARRLAAGDFSTEVPTQGHDEFAALGAEFNKMSHQLEGRMEELRQERARLEDSIRRIGETFASGLDRVGLLEIVVRTSLDAVNADCGRASVRDHADAPLRQVAVAGDLGVHGEVLHAAEVLAHDSGRPESANHNGHSALAYPVAPEEGEESALLSVARAGRPFTQRERELFNYLARQMAISMENVGLHEVVQRQALTDDLTGLSNHRRFQDVIEAEVGRGKRFEHSVGLIMLDIDDFKQINDTYGHQQGDLVLSEVGRVVRAGSRDIDEPARYGGEELAVALPETDLDGAYLLAERMRLAIEALEIPRLDGHGVLRVTASFGAAALPDSADDRSALVSAADAALYRAKRAGKNRTEVAGRLAASAATGE
jgi:diguanylate cyclase (GGDEF)-like protein